MTNDRIVAVYIHKVVSHDGDRLVVDGACTRDVLRLGDLFRVAFRYPFPKSKEGLSDERQPVAQRRVSLRVKAITAYQQSFDELESGMTGRFELEGVGGELLMENDVIGSEYVPG